MKVQLLTVRKRALEKIISLSHARCASFYEIVSLPGFVQGDHPDQGRQT
jgi:hypothetical protein